MPVSHVFCLWKKKKKIRSQILLSADRSELNEEMSEKKWKIKRKNHFPD